MATETDPLLDDVTSHNTIQQSKVESDGEETDPVPSKRRHWRNILVLCFAWLFNFTAIASFQNLQSSLNPIDGLGDASFCAVYAGSIISGFYAPFVIKRLGQKWTITISMCCYAVYTVSNFYPEFYTLVPAGALMGLASNPMWTSEGTYIATTALSYASLTGLATEIVINRFNGLFYFFFQSAQISGNLIASLILYPSSTQIPPDANLTQYCGVRSCGVYVDRGEGTPQTPSKDTLYTLFSVYLVCNIIAFFLILIFLDKLYKPVGYSDRLDDSCGGKLIVTARLMFKDWRMFLLIPLLTYSGAQKAFIAVDFTKAFVNCTQGIHFIGFVMMSYGITDAISCLVLTRLQKYVGRVALFTAGAVADLMLLSLMGLVWTPSHDHIEVLFVAAAVWGFGDSVWQTQIASLLGVTFLDNLAPAYSNFRLFQALGNGIMFAVSTSSAVCVYEKMIGLAALLGITMTCYYAMEIKLRWMRKNHRLETVAKTTTISED